MYVPTSFVSVIIAFGSHTFGQPILSLQTHTTTQTTHLMSVGGASVDDELFWVGRVSRLDVRRDVGAHIPKRRRLRCIGAHETGFLAPRDVRLDQEPRLRVISAARHRRVAADGAQDELLAQVLVRDVRVDQEPRLREISSLRAVCLVVRVLAED